MAKNNNSKQVEVQDEGKVMIDKNCFKIVQPINYDIRINLVAADLEREFKENKLFILH